MKAPIEWMNDLIKDKLPETEIVADKMTMTGSKVEGILRSGSELSGIFTGRIISIKEHPDAEKLVICDVEVGDKTVQIVTGAPNVFEGAVVPTALDGAVLSGGVKIKTAKLRGIRSEGMMCSIQELGFDVHFFPEAPEDGIYVFPYDIKSGVEIKEALKLGEDVLDFEITSNRPDCFSVEGLAREAAVSFNIPFKQMTPLVKGTKGFKTSNILKVEIRDRDLCPRYVARAVRNIKIGPSPLWMTSRLRNCGVRPINNIVDITNYVMLELGQPMHAFDHKDIKDGTIIVRRAGDKEKLVTLDEVEHVLDDNMLVIADKEKAVGMAGIMGGEDSSIDESTKMIIFESANFDAVNIRLSAKKLGVRTESSSRFEKGLDPENTIRAMNRACELVEILGCGEVSEEAIDVCSEKKGKIEVSFDPYRINSLLGTDISSEWMLSLLEKLGCKITADGDATICTPPSFRPDLEQDIDLAEEIARFYGYNNIEATLLSGKSTTLGGYDHKQKQKKIVSDVMKASGFFQACTYSFMSPKSLGILRMDEEAELKKAVKISNPLGEDYSLMRTSMLPSLADIARTNLTRGNTVFSIYEIAKVYSHSKEKQNYISEEKDVLAAVAYDEGESYEKAETFMRLKGLADELFRQTGTEQIVYEKCDDDPSFHPGRCVRITMGGRDIGRIGHIHPEAAHNTQTDKAVAFMIIYMDIIENSQGKKKVYSPLPRFPAISRDIAVIVDMEVPASSIESVLRSNGGDLLEKCELFDVYTGKQIKENKKSIAYTLVFRSKDKTLKDEDIDPLIERMLDTLKSGLKADLR